MPDLPIYEDEVEGSFFSRLFSLRSAVCALFFCPLLLTIFGFLAIGSASIFRSGVGHPYQYIVLQAIWFAVSLAAMCIIAYAPFLNYRLLAERRIVAIIAIFVLAMLVIVLVPGIGRKINGSRRWISLGLMNIQPSEFAKIGFVFCLAKWFDEIKSLSHTFAWGIVAPGVWCGIVCLLLFCEPDYGSAILVATVTAAVMFVAGAPKMILVPLAGLGASAFGAFVMLDPVRGGRVLSFLHPELYPDKAYQLLQAIAAFKNGGLFGVGMGNSIQKLDYLPEAHTDCVIAIAGEEFGFVSMVLVLIVFLVLLYAGICVARAAHDRFGRLLAFGLIFMLITQAGVNFGVNTGCLPTKGMALPFISYGGTSLLASWMLVGLLINIGRVTLLSPAGEDSRKPVFRNNVHRI